MIEALIVTALAVAFLVVLFAGGERFRRRQINMDGDAPIDKTLFYGSKYLILVLWAAMILDSWGINLSFFTVPPPLRTIALCLWVMGFILLLTGRFTLGSSFRIGRPKESTSLRVNGLFRISRNPMYLGMYSTLLAAAVYTLNPVLFLLAAFIIAVHHRIVIAEETHLRATFGNVYEAYSRRVRRYL
jgi:protein-S-isoprenylcysteine O-methyltransferase Ste14